eukprot:SM000286S10653  [mRNA]  locus=s286:66148:82554:- [translate_table: standard]
MTRDMCASHCSALGSSGRPPASRRKEVYVRDWLEQRVGFRSNFDISFYPGRFSTEKRSILAVGDIMDFVPETEADVAVLEEPEHLTWYHHGQRWTKRFQHVVGVVHTNYLEYVRREKNGAAQAFVLEHVNNWLARSYCHKVLRLSAATQELPRSMVCNVHGVCPKFLDIGERVASAKLEGRPVFNRGAYYLGKMVWSKGYRELVDLLAENKATLGSLKVDVFGTGEDSGEVQATAQARKLRMRFHKGRDHADAMLQQYKVFINPSLSDVVCTTTAEALAMGKLVVCADHPSNEFFRSFPNCLIYKTGQEFVEKVQEAVARDPVPLTAEQRHLLSWEAATDRFIESADLDKPLQKEMPRSKSIANLASAGGNMAAAAAANAEAAENATLRVPLRQWLVELVLIICRANVLLLRDSITLHAQRVDISGGDLLTLIAEKLLINGATRQGRSSSSIQQEHQDIADAINLLPLLATRTELDVRFNRSRMVHMADLSNAASDAPVAVLNARKLQASDSLDVETRKEIGRQSHSMLLKRAAAYRSAKGLQSTDRGSQAHARQPRARGPSGSFESSGRVQSSGPPARLGAPRAYEKRRPAKAKDLPAPAVVPLPGSLHWSNVDLKAIKGVGGDALPAKVVKDVPEASLSRLQAGFAIPRDQQSAHWRNHSESPSDRAERTQGAVVAPASSQSRLAQQSQASNGRGTEAGPAQSDEPPGAEPALPHDPRQPAPAAEAEDRERWPAAGRCGTGLSVAAQSTSNPAGDELTSSASGTSLDQSRPGLPPVDGDVEQALESGGVGARSCRCGNAPGGGPDPCSHEPSGAEAGGHSTVRAEADRSKGGDAELKPPPAFPGAGWEPSRAASLEPYVLLPTQSGRGDGDGADLASTLTAPSPLGLQQAVTTLSGPEVDAEEVRLTTSSSLPPRSPRSPRSPRQSSSPKQAHAWHAGPDQPLPRSPRRGPHLLGTLGGLVQASPYQSLPVVPHTLGTLGGLVTPPQHVTSPPGRPVPEGHPRRPFAALEEAVQSLGPPSPLSSLGSDLNEQRLLSTPRVLGTLGGLVSIPAGLPQSLQQQSHLTSLLSANGEEGESFGFGGLAISPPLSPWRADRQGVVGADNMGSSPSTPTFSSKLDAMLLAQVFGDQSLEKSGEEEAGRNRGLGAPSGENVGHSDEVVEDTAHREHEGRGGMARASEAQAAVHPLPDLEVESAEAVHEGRIVEFLKESTRQPTPHGILWSSLWRIYAMQYEGNLFMLVSDQSYLDQPNIVWEKLGQAEGAPSFYDSSFHPYEPVSVLREHLGDRAIMDDTSAVRLPDMGYFPSYNQLDNISINFLLSHVQYLPTIGKPVDGSPAPAQQPTLPVEPQGQEDSERKGPSLSRLPTYRERVELVLSSPGSESSREHDRAKGDKRREKQDCAVM